jgi:asparagine synthase (glutamine-hydrolysing)
MAGVTTGSGALAQPQQPQKPRLTYRVRVYGYCAESPEQLLGRFERDGAAGLGGLADVEGEFVVVFASEADDECVIATSAYGVCNYFYALRDGAFSHGDTVAAVLRGGRLPWRWNWRALADALQLGHVLGEETLHPDVSRVPPAAVLHFRGGELRLTRKGWDELHPRGPADPRAAVARLNEETLRWHRPGSVVSISGGFDSRLILSTFLNAGIKPALLAMGREDSTDVVTSRAIADRFGLEMTTVAPTPEDYLADGPRISELSNGTKSAENWHTYIYPRLGGLDPAAPFFVGSNGEFARVFFVDRGLLTRVMDRLPEGRVMSKVWRTKLRPHMSPAESAGLHPAFAAELGEAAQAARVERLIALCPGGLLRGMQQFYVEQRVRHFIGNGLKLYSDHAAWRTPMLSRAWCREAWNLPQRWRLGSAWHRFAIARNFPALLEFPEQGTGHNMLPKPPPLYWLPGRRKKVKTVHYANYNRWFQQPPLHDFMRGSASVLSELIEPAKLNLMLDVHQRTHGRAALLGFWMSMAHWIPTVRRATAAAGPADN